MRVFRILPAVLSLTIGVLPMVAPEHAHEQEEHGHTKVVVHRHVEAHGVLEHHRLPQTLLDHDDEPVLTLDASFTVPPSIVLATPERTVSTLIEPASPGRIERSLTKFDVPIHGPPRAPTGLRAPPLPPAT